MFASRERERDGRKGEARKRERGGEGKRQKVGREYVTQVNKVLGMKRNLARLAYSPAVCRRVCSFPVL